jgi:hypothetical protein
VRAPIVCCQCVAIGANGATYDAALVVSSFAGGFLPWPIIGHRTFDGEHTTVMVGHDEVERLAKVISTRHGRTLLLIKSAAEGSSEVIRLAKPHPHLLAEPEQRCTQQGNRQEEKYRGPVDMLQPKEGASEAHDQKQGCAYPASKREACCIVQ